MIPPTNHQSIQVESFEREGKVLLRPIDGQSFPPTLLLEGNKSLVNDYPVGTRFKVQVTLMQRSTGARFLYSSWQWDAQVLWRPDDEAA